MPLPSAYQLALEMFDLAIDTSAARREVWELLSPLMDHVIQEQEQRTIQFAPHYRELMEKNRQRSAEVIATSTERLFTQPFNEAWVAATKERVKAERELGYDMRVRAVVASIILSHLNRATLQKRWWPRRRCVALVDMAQRVLTMDSANAAAIHYHIEARKAEAKTNQLDSAIVSFGESIESVRRAIDTAVIALDSTSQLLAGLAESAADQVKEGTTAADQAAMNVRQMAAATEELTASIAEVHQQASLACARAQEAVSDANSMNNVVQLLAQAVGKIGSVANLITDIAEQTNLLALNATIEAARAGQHGRGFAVVASEVKVLASQTADATKHIGDQIALIERTTKKSIDELGATRGKIAEIANASKLVETSVTEQVHATTEIAASASNAAANAANTATSLKAVADVINSAKDNAGLILGSARQLSVSMRKVDEAMDNLLRASHNAGIEKLADLKKNTIAV